MPRHPRGTVTRVGDRWRARIQRDGRRASATFASAADAWAWCARIADGQPGDSLALTLGDVLAEWQAVQGASWAPSTADRTARVLDLLPPGLVALPLDRVTPVALAGALDAAAWAERRDGGGPVAQNTLDVLTVALRSACRFGEATGAFARSPAAHLRKPRSRAAEDPRGALDVAQVHALAAATDVRYRAFVWLLAGAALRWGEAASVRVDCAAGDHEHTTLDLGAQVLHVRRRLDGRTRTEERPKTRGSAAPVPLPGWLCDVLTAHLDAGHSDGVWLTPAARGGPLVYPAWLARVWRPALTAAKAADPSWPTWTVTPHTLRHTAASVAIAHGATLAEAAYLLRHSSLEMVTRRYAHTVGPTDERLRTALAPLAPVEPEREPEADGGAAVIPFPLRSWGA